MSTQKPLGPPLSLSRRGLLRGMAAGTGVLAAGGLAGLSRSARGGDGPRFLIVLGCFGGASMIDCLMPIDASEAYTSESRGKVIGYATARPGGGAIRCVDRATPTSFVERYHDQMVVMGSQASSVNHFTAQARAVNGRGVFSGRTLAEAVAAVHGQGMALPNVNMGRGGFAEPGTDGSLSARYRAEIVANPVTFPLSTSGWRGVIKTGDLRSQDPDAMAALVAQARSIRDGRLEQLSPFARTFSSSPLRQSILTSRAQDAAALEVQDLIQKLMFVPDLGEALPLNEYGLSASEEANRILSYLPDAFPQDTSGTADDRLQAQAALAYLLLKSGTSCAVTLTDPGTDGFLAFDQSHQSHAYAQQVHWDRALDVADRLIQLLQLSEYEDTGESLWDRSALLFATEFGRDKWDTGGGGDFGTGHHLNNGTLIVSPLLKGGQSLGLPDPNNGFICGFDAETGEPTPFTDIAPGEDPLFTDERLPPGEEAVFGTILSALGVEFDGQETLPVALK